MNRKPISVNPENNTLMGIEKIHEIRQMLIQILKQINDAKSNNGLDAEKPLIFEKLDQLMTAKEKLMTCLQKCELESEIKESQIRRRNSLQDYSNPDKNSMIEYEKKFFLQKLLTILKKFDYEVLILKFKKLGNNLKAFAFVFDVLFVVYIYIEKPKSKSDKNKLYRVFDIVVTSIKDKGGAREPMPLKPDVWNDIKDVKEFREKDISDANLKTRVENKIQSLKKNFEAHFLDLVFEPETILFQRISFFIRKVFFHQNPKAQTIYDLEHIFLWYLNGYRTMFSFENVECCVCKRRMIFDSERTGFLPCTICKNNKFYHDKCFVEK